uniref:CPBP family intramembrane glutamic endopeptidase n=1 Tax=Trichocoleus desertorum TaxID=1481672 RepID=UPI0025B599C7|nr:type II CAAX endopeptidase family protein [Trichocoleus desertorum]
MKLHLTRLAHYPALIRLAVFVVSLLLVWLPVAGPIYWLLDDQNLISILTLTLLYIEFILLARFWGRRVYQDTAILQSYGLEFSRRNGLELLSGLGIGLGSLLGMFWLEGALGWLNWQVPSVFLPQIILEGLLVSLGIGFAEELFFRGWLLHELERDYRPNTALGVASTVFALAHFIKPIAEIRRTWINFPALVLLGLALGWAKRATQAKRSLDALSDRVRPRFQGQLGLPIGLHAGLVWGYYIINVGQLMRYSGRVPEWVTGIDGNPLAGTVGFLCLSLIALGMNLVARKRQAIAK